MTVELLKDLDRDGGWTLMVGGAEQSYVDVADATHLEFEYMQHLALVVDVVFDSEMPLDVVHLGGGALTMPRWFAATRPTSRQIVFESSAEILDAVRPLGSVPSCDVRLGEALAGVAALHDASADVLVWDLYDGPRAVTAALDLEALRQMYRVLRPGGVALLNVSDVQPFAVVRPVLAGLRVVSDDVALLAEPSTLRGRRSGNCVLIAGRGALPSSGFRRAAAAAPARGRVMSGEVLTEFIGSAVPATHDAPLPQPDEDTGRAFL
jgi:spermidine synthase